MLLGHTLRQIGTCFIYGTLTHSGRPSQIIRLHTPTPARPHVEDHQWPHNTAHATPTRLTHIRFRLIRVRSPLLTESFLFSLPVGTEMFHFPTFPPHTLYIQMRVTTHNMPRGFPIRTPSDHRSFTNSPRLIAGYHVLHRLLMPRHPPCALEHSHTPQQTGVHESDNTRNTTKTKSQQKKHNSVSPDARVHYPLTQQHPDTHTHTRTTSAAACRAGTIQKNNHNQEGHGPVLPGPNNVFAPPDTIRVDPAGRRFM